MCWLGGNAGGNAQRADVVYAVPPALRTCLLTYVLYFLTAQESQREASRFDGFEGCWLVWSIEPERRGGGGEDDDGDDDAPANGPPGLERALPTVELAGGRL